jgi:hypothetical protein
MVKSHPLGRNADLRLKLNRRSFGRWVREEVLTRPLHVTLSVLAILVYVL